MSTSSAALSLMGQASESAERKRGYILYHFLFLQMVSLWPCSWYVIMVSLPLTGAFIHDSVSHWCSFYQSACPFLSALPGFPLLYLLLYNRGQLLAGETAHCGLSWPYLLPLHLGRNARCRLYTHFDHTVKRECFLLLLDGTFKKPFLHPLCLRRMSDENSDRFFPTRSASSGIVSGPLLPLVPNPPTSSLKHQIFHFQGRVSGLRRWDERGGRDTAYFENKLGTLKSRVWIVHVFQQERWEAGKYKQLN